MNGYVGPPPGGPADGFDAPDDRAGRSGEGGILPSVVCCGRSGGEPVPGPCTVVRIRPATAEPPGRASASKIHDRSSMPTMPRSSPSAATEPASYEQALAELEALVQAMEAGKMPLDQLLASYKRGAELLRQCRDRLQVVEDQVKVLEDGQLKPWTPA